MKHKKAAYKAYPRIVKNSEGKGVRVQNAAEEAAISGIDIADIDAKNASRDLSADEKLARAEKLFDDAQAEKKAAAELLQRAEELSASADDKLNDASKLAPETASTVSDGSDNQEVQNASSVPAGDKKALELYAKRFGEDFAKSLDLRKSFEVLLEIVQQEEAKNA